MTRIARTKKRTGKIRLKNHTVIILCALGVILVAGMIFSVIQRNNIAALTYSLIYTPEELNAKIEDNEQKLDEIMSKALPSRVRDLTDVEKELLATNDITKEEAVKILVDDTDQQPRSQYLATGAVDEEAPETEFNGLEYDESEASNPPVGGPPDTLSALPAASPLTGGADRLDEQERLIITESKLTELIAEAYVLRAYYTSQLEGMRASATADFKALNPEEQTQQRRLTIGMNYLDRAGALESECDGLMTNLIARIDSELKKSGGDTSIISEIKSYYAEEKSLKKAYYMSLFSYKTR